MQQFKKQQNMKKTIILVLAILFSFTVVGQEYIPGQLQLGATPLSNNSDYLSALGTVNGNANIVTKTQITVQQLTDVINAGIPNLQTVTDQGNTTSNTIINTGGNYIASGSTGSFVASGGGSVSVLGAGANLLKDAAMSNSGYSVSDLNFTNNITTKYELDKIQLSSTNNGSSLFLNFPYSEIKAASFGTSYNQVFQYKDGTIALTSDLVGKVPYSGASSNVNLGVYDLYADLGAFTTSVSAPTVVAVGTDPVIQVNDSSVGGGSVYVRMHNETDNANITLPSSDGKLARIEDIPNASTTSYDFGGVISWNPAQGGKTNLQLGNSNLHNVGFYASAINFLNTTNDNLIVLRNNNYSYGYTILTSSTLTQNESLVLPNGSGDLSLIRTINTSTPQTSATLNGSFPNAEIGSRVVNLDSTQRYTYTKVSATSWRRSELMTDI